MNLTFRILIGMASGVTVGLVIQQLDPPVSGWVHVYFLGGLIDIGGSIFIASLKLLVVPLVFFSLVCGAASLGESNSIGRLGGKALGLYLTTTAIAISLALVLGVIISPGVGADIAVPASFEPREVPPLKTTLINIFPTNPVAAMAEGKMLQIIVFALMLGVAITKAGEAGARVRPMFVAMNDVLMKLITILISLAPYGVFCLMTGLFVTVGWEEIGRLIGYFLTVVATLLLHLTVVYPTLLTVLGRLNPIRFLAKMREPMLLGFSTSSSGATLPVTLRTVEHRVGVKNEVASFAVPLGATINMDGTAIMQGVATVFIAQFYGIDLSIAQLLMVVLTATMASIGTAAVPGVGLVTLTMVLTQAGLPVEGIMLIIGVDRLLDMMRTAVNICGDGMVATVVARSEDKFDMAIFSDSDAGRVVDVKPDRPRQVAPD